MTPSALLRVVGSLTVALAWPALCAAQPSAAPVVEGPAPDSHFRLRSAAAGELVLSGYAEVGYTYNFARPSNGINNFRAFDFRDETISLQNVVLAADWTRGPVFGRVAIQSGLTGDAYYTLSEPSFRGASGAPPVTPAVFEHVQEATFGIKAGKAWTFDAGLFLSPIGPESMAVKDSWNWSRSNLFFGLPFYHSGVRVAYAPSSSLSLRLSAYNGWNDAVDINQEKSVSLKATAVLSKRVTLDAQYFGGVERPPGAPEGRPWRHLLDVYTTVHATDALEFTLNADGGFEDNHFGLSLWSAAAVFARARFTKWLYAAARADEFSEHDARDAASTAAPIAFPVSHIGSAVFTLDVRPAEALSVRLEYRHDAASQPAFFSGHVAGDGSAEHPYLANARTQDSLTLGATAWF